MAPEPSASTEQASSSARIWASRGRASSGSSVGSWISPSAPSVQVTRSTRMPSATRRAIVPPVPIDSSSGWAWTNITPPSGGIGDVPDQGLECDPRVTLADGRRLFDSAVLQRAHPTEARSDEQVRSLVDDGIGPASGKEGEIAPRGEPVRGITDPQTGRRRPKQRRAPRAGEDVELGDV